MQKEGRLNLDSDVIVEFYYAIDGKKIEAHFVTDSPGPEENHILTIEGWTDAQGRKTGEKRYYNLSSFIGVIWMIYEFNLKDNRLDMIVHMVDDRICDLYFINPKVKCTLNGEMIFSYG
ncbi:MAG: hypothetical protein PF588_05765 [Candidatus Kapabacteria bacterium]|jgi:hypothetical protein|nr:hypothetical protein [Candidatus Kapabacteria bacterium]